MDLFGTIEQEMPLAGWGKVLHYEQEIAAADHPDIRLFQIKKTTSLTPSEEVQSTMDGWQPCAPEIGRGIFLLWPIFMPGVEPGTGRAGRW